MRLKSKMADSYSIEKKNKFRQNSKNIMLNMSSQKRLYCSKMVVKKLENVLSKLDKKTTLFYIPLEIEVDVMPLIRKLRKKRKSNIYVPFMECKSFKVVKYRLPMYKKQFNIMEPQNSWAITPKIDVVVAPVIGVDGMIRRVGFGKGMYDRFFSKLPYKPIVIFVQLNTSFTKEYICEPHDIQGDIYITPTDTIIKRGIDDFRGWNRHSCRSCYRDSRVFNCKKNRFSKS